MIATYLEDPEVGEVSRRTMFVRYNGLLDDRRASRSSSRAASTSAARCSRTAWSRTTRRRPSARTTSTLTPTQPSGFGCPCHGGQYDTEGNRTAGPPVRALDRSEFSIIDGNLWLGELSSASARSRARAPTRGSRSTAARARASTSTASRPGSTRSRCRPSSGDARRRRRSQRAARASRRSSLYPLDWLEERSGLVGGIKYFLFRKVPARLELVPHARLGDADRLHRPGGHRRDPRDVLQAGPRHGVRVDPDDHERPDARLARPRHAPLGRERLHHPDVPAHGARVPVRRLQVPARAELDHRRAAPRARDARGLHRLPAAVGPDRVLGDRRRDQHQRHGAVPRPVPRAVPPGRRRDRREHAEQVLLAAHARHPGRDHRPDRAAPVPRRPARRHLAAVVARGRGPRPGAGRRRARTAARASSGPPRGETNGR